MAQLLGILAPQHFVGALHLVDQMFDSLLLHLRLESLLDDLVPQSLQCTRQLFDDHVVSLNLLLMDV